MPYINVFVIYLVRNTDATLLVYEIKRVTEIGAGKLDRSSTTLQIKYVFCFVYYSTKSVV